MIGTTYAMPLEVKRCAWWGSFVVACMFVGCGTPPPCQVTGTVHVNNAPASRVYVVLHNNDGSTAGAGCTGEDGKYQLAVTQPGEYPVTCFFPKVTKVMDDVIEGEDQFQGRFRDWQKPVTKATVKAGDNPLPTIELR